MNNDQQLLNYILREELYTFIKKCFETLNPAEKLLENWHLEAIAWQLTRCMTGETKRLIITVPPRYLKSICSSVAFVAFILGHDPTKKIVCASYSAELALKHARDCRAIMQTSWYQNTFPNTRLSKDRYAEHDFTTTMRGFRLATSVGGTLTGRGGTFIIVDDPMNAVEASSAAARKSVSEWFDKTLYTRSDDKKNSCMIVIMQRLHVDDLVGHILSKGEKWEHLNLPAIAQEDQIIKIGEDRYHYRKVGDLLHAEREGMEELNRTRGQMGSGPFDAQYLQTPVPADGEIFKWPLINFYTEKPKRVVGSWVVQSWDMASKAGELNDYSVCTTWLAVPEKGKTNYYLLDLFRARLSYPDLRQAVYQQERNYPGAEIIIEDTAAGTAILQELKIGSLARSNKIRGIKPVGDKVMRASVQSATFESGRVWFPKDAPWLEALRLEMLQFPNSRYDDQVDSITQFLGHMAVPKYYIRQVKI